ncbi:MAG: acyl dehydratase [Rhodobacteraceae bacterium]|nr:acyl dehydratase [Paracoccaceae bacterium]
MTHVGKTREQNDRIDPERVAALHAMLSRSGPPPQLGDALPPFWHYIQFWDAKPPAALGRDGHPKIGDFIPDLGLPRRMWAGGKLKFKHPLIIGEKATKLTRITNVAEKQGATGPLAVISMTHDFVQNGRTCIQEDQSLLYREDHDPLSPAPIPPAAPTNEPIRRDRSFSPTDLFRYSALTFNGHRIHYDRDYANDVEGYPGLVVHGPLLAQTLIEIAEGMLGQLNVFVFRTTAPLFDHETAQFCALPTAEGLDLWVRGPDGRMCMTATAQ